MPPLLDDKCYCMEFSDMCRRIFQFGRKYLTKLRKGMAFLLKDILYVFLEASIYIKYGLLKLGSTNTGEYVTANLDFQKMPVSFSPQKSVFFVSFSFS